MIWLIQTLKLQLLILLLCFYQFLIVATSSPSSTFTCLFSLVRINNHDQNNDDGNISTEQSEHIIPVEFQHEQSEEITEKGQLRKKESFESQGIK